MDESEGGGMPREMRLKGGMGQAVILEMRKRRVARVSTTCL